MWGKWTVATGLRNNLSFLYMLYNFGQWHRGHQSAYFHDLCSQPKHSKFLSKIQDFQFYWLIPLMNKCAGVDMAIVLLSSAMGVINSETGVQPLVTHNAASPLYHATGDLA